MKMLAEYPVGTLRNATTVANKVVVATAVKNMPGVGQPFFIFNSLPSAALTCDFSMFPAYVVSAVVAENLAMIEEMIAMEDDDPNPLLSALTF